MQLHNIRDARKKHAVPDSPADVCLRVAAEIITVLLVDGFQKQCNFAGYSVLIVNCFPQNNTNKVRNDQLFKMTVTIYVLWTIYDLNRTNAGIFQRSFTSGGNCPGDTKFLALELSVYHRDF